MPVFALTQLWKPIALLGLVAALMVYRAAIIHQRDAARRQVNADQAEIMRLQASNAALTGAVAQQNAAVEGLRARMQASALAAGKREAAYANQGGEIMRQETARARAMIKAPVEAGCAGAIEWGNAQGPELGRW